MSCGDISADYPDQPEPAVESAAKDLPAVLQDMPNETGYGASEAVHGQRIVLAQHLVDELARRHEHSRAAAAWAVQRLVERGLLLAEVGTMVDYPVVGYRPDENSTVVRSPGIFGCQADHPRYQVPIYGDPVRKPLAPSDRPVPYDCLLVRSTVALWEWQQASAAGPAAADGRREPPAARAPAPQVTEQETPFITTELQDGILQALDGKALTLDALVAKLGVDRSTLNRFGVKELKARGLIANNRRVGGYYRPDAPPPKYAAVLGQKLS
jgi:predicted transcriptional regulator